jgi:hypothetical protein
MIRKAIATSGLVLAVLALQLGAGSSTAEACNWWGGGCGSGCGYGCGSGCGYGCGYGYRSAYYPPNYASYYNPYAPWVNSSPCNSCNYAPSSCSSCAPACSSCSSGCSSCFSGCNSCSASYARPTYSGYAAAGSGFTPKYVSVGTKRYFSKSGTAPVTTPRPSVAATPVRYSEARKPSLVGFGR